MINDEQLVFKDTKINCCYNMRMIHYPFLRSGSDVIFHYGESEKAS